MSKFCLGSYLKILRYCRYKSCTQKELVGTIMHFHNNRFDENDDSQISNIVAGRKNPPDYVVEQGSNYLENNYPDLVSYFGQQVIPLLDQNKIAILLESIYTIVEDDNDIQDSCEIDVIGHTTKGNMRDNHTDNTTFLAGVFLYLLKTNNNSGMEKHVRELNSTFFKRITKTIGKPPKKSERKPHGNEEAIYQEAQDFCVTYEEEIELLPLCQIAAYIDPLHNYVRPMYTSYCKLSRSAKKKVLKLKNITVMDFPDSEWVSRSISLFDSMIREKKLCTKQFLYDGAKYFHRAYYNYSNYYVEFNPAMFKRLIKQNKRIIPYETNCTLGTVIGEYLELKANKSRRKLTPPIDAIWSFCASSETDESIVTYWVSMIIISVSYHLYYEPIDCSESLANSMLSIDLGDSEHLINTQEDMYLYALLELYKLQYSHSNH